MSIGCTRCGEVAVNRIDSAVTLRHSRDGMQANLSRLVCAASGAPGHFLSNCAVAQPKRNKDGLGEI